MYKISYDKKITAPAVSRLWSTVNSVVFLLALAFSFQAQAQLPLNQKAHQFERDMQILLTELVNYKRTRPFNERASSDRVLMGILPKAIPTVDQLGILNNSHFGGNSPRRSAIDNTMIQLNLVAEEQFPSLQPRYAYLVDSLETFTYAPQYGEVLLLFRKTVHERTTVSIGDSLDDNSRMIPFGDEEIIKTRDANYREAQMHGPLRLSDVEAIYVELKEYHSDQNKYLRLAHKANADLFVFEGRRTSGIVALASKIERVFSAAGDRSPETHFDLTAKSVDPVGKLPKSYEPKDILLLELAASGAVSVEEIKPYLIKESSLRLFAGIQSGWRTFLYNVMLFGRASHSSLLMALDYYSQQWPLDTYLKFSIEKRLAEIKNPAHRQQLQEYLNRPLGQPPKVMDSQFKALSKMGYIFSEVEIKNHLELFAGGRDIYELSQNRVNFLRGIKLLSLLPENELKFHYYGGVMAIPTGVDGAPIDSKLLNDLCDIAVDALRPQNRKMMLYWFSLPGSFQEFYGSTAEMKLLDKVKSLPLSDKIELFNHLLANDFLAEETPSFKKTFVQQFFNRLTPDEQSYLVMKLARVQFMGFVPLSLSFKGQRVGTAEAFNEALKGLAASDISKSLLVENQDIKAAIEAHIDSLKLDSMSPSQRDRLWEIFALIHKSDYDFEAEVWDKLVEKKNALFQPLSCHALF